DSNETFKEYQCSIKSLTKETNINFAGLYKYDTFDKTNPNESMRINSVEEVESLITRNKKTKKSRAKKPVLLRAAKAKKSR
ncbi:MAG TPA: hypothetical protein VGO58_00050, partial [Chitinophagaceae bacterium]|nr:hypothetical protein [Chitinophagaceae bacterium]